jgi:hypothetical protein
MAGRSVEVGDTHYYSECSYDAISSLAAEDGQRARGRDGGGKCRLRIVWC